MKTIEQLYKEIMSDKELKAQAVEAAKAGRLEAFLKEHDCGATLEEVSTFLTEKSNEDKPLSVDELENASGGGCNAATAQEAVISVIGFFGLGCVAHAIISASESDSYVGQREERDGRLCNDKK